MSPTVLRRALKSQPRGGRAPEKDVQPPPGGEKSRLHRVLGELAVREGAPRGEVHGAEIFPVQRLEALAGLRLRHTHPPLLISSLYA